MSDNDKPKRSDRLILWIFIGLALVTIGGTLISNFVMWRNYDATETEQHILPAEAIPLPRG